MRELVEHFYDAMDGLPEARAVRALHAEDLAEMRGRLYEYLSGWMGGPPLFVQRRGALCIRQAHVPVTIDARARDQWLLCMARAMDEMKVETELRGQLDHAFAQMAEMLRNAPD